MALFERLYGKPDYSGDYFYGPSSYQPIINWIGEVVTQHDDQDYQGDTYAILRQGEHYGYLCFGWGSCSGCDALQACTSPSEVEELAESLRNRVRWMSRDEMVQWLRDHDWAGDYNPNGATFAQKAIEILTNTGAPDETE